MTTFDSEFDDLRRTFIAGAEENLAAMEALVLILENGATDEGTLQALFRSAHTLKGDAACMQFGALTAVAHAAEDLLDRVRSRRRPFDRAVASALLHTVDVLRRMTREAINGSSGSSDEAAAIIAELEKVALDSTAAAGPGTGAANSSSSATLLDAKSLRVALPKLDLLMSIAGQLSVTASRMATLIGERPADMADLQDTHERTEALLRNLSEAVLSVRLVPATPLFRHMARVARDTAAALGKEVRFVTEGDDVELDASLLDLLKDPLTHMIRNAVDHGIEPAWERRAAGKAEVGLITVRTFRDRAEVIVDLHDDGRGLDCEKIAGLAVARGVISSADGLSEQQIRALIFHPGFSTAPEVTSISGRGVGLDIVQRNVEVLRGAIEIESEAGCGTRVRLRLPSSLSIVSSFAVDVSDQTFLLPAAVVAECVELPPGTEAAKRFGRQGEKPRFDGEILSVRGEPLPFIHLRDAFGIGGTSNDRDVVVVVRCGGQRIGLGVDALGGQHDAIVKPLDVCMRRLRTFSGSAILGDGRAALVVDVAALVDQLVRGQ